ncbi:hypothetical protein A8B82_04470 [Sulfitobacter sp. EhC04]|uniref:hypothetical protein n=1 Tax=Sulfitobacter sp. EhC04 TaxID=1849168 RepID=UPI0007F38D7F|nr:hypothetical protein [Sulfitobacter sp. EhC04]OAN71541.1 hypothetical protein A8B82_04470 [Sulfitobacter sp. EhC04]
MTEPKTLTEKIIDGGKIAGAISAMMALSIMVWGFTAGPVRDWLAKFEQGFEAQQDMQQLQQEMQHSQQDILADISAILLAQSHNVKRIEALESAKTQDASPAIRFTMYGHSIEDGRPGQVVEIKWQFVKLRDCGRPEIDLLFRNGGGRLHRFQNVSVLDTEGIGVAADPDPSMAQTISYTARIPDNEGVHAGRSFAWVRVGYPECPTVPAVTSPEVAFRILS